MKTDKSVWQCLHCPTKIYGIGVKESKEELQTMIDEHLASHSMNMGITTFASGAIRDSQEGKEDYIETISWTAMKRYAQYMTSKKSKYGAGNFKKGIDIESYEQSLLRHIQKYLANKYEDGTIETNEDHLSAILFNVFGIIHEEERNK